MNRPIVIRYPDGREYGVENAEIAQQAHSGATIVRYQDGGPIPPPAPVKATKPKDDPA